MNRIEKNKDESTMSPVPNVPNVPNVPKSEGDKGDKGDKGDRGQHTITLDSEFQKGKSEKERLSCTYYQNPNGLTDIEASVILNIERDSIKKYRGRLSEHQQIETVGAERPQKFTLSDLGRAKLEKAYLEWRQSQSEAERRRIEAEQAKEDIGFRTMELPEQIEQFQSLFSEDPYKTALHKQVQKGRGWIEVQFNDIARHSPELADLLLEEPEDLLKAAQIAIEKMDIPHETESMLRIEPRIVGLPEQISIGTLKTAHINKLLSVEGQVFTVGDRRPQMTSAKFECPTCGNIIPVLQLDPKFKEPSRCGCGRKGKFKILSKELVDTMLLLIQQPIIEVAGKGLRPSTLRVFLKNDLTRPEVRETLGLNRMVRIVGVLKETPVLLRTGGQSTRFDWIFEANSITLVENYDPKIRLTPERIAEIHLEAAAPNFKQRLRDSYFPDHIGDDKLCEVLLCQSVAMPLHLHTKEAWEQAVREAVHILIMTPPGMGKSRNLARRIGELVPIVGRANGTGATRAGLTIGADLKDKDSDLVIPTPQALPNANLGVFIFDEADKMKIEEQPVMNEAMSEHQVTVTKRGANLTLPAMISYLGMANPKSADWNLDLDSLQEVLNIHFTTITRCFVHVGYDVAKEARDRQIALMILRRDEVRARPFDDEFLKDFILLARGTISPKIVPQHEEALADFYAKLRQMQTKKYLGPRFVEQTRSLALLHAKMHLREFTTEEDLMWVNDLLIQELTSVGFDPGRLPNTLPRMVSK